MTRSSLMWRRDAPQLQVTEEASMLTHIHLLNVDWYPSLEDGIGYRHQNYSLLRKNEHEL